MSLRLRGHEQPSLDLAPDPRMEKLGVRADARRVIGRRLGERDEVLRGRSSCVDGFIKSHRDVCRNRRAV